MFCDSYGIQLLIKYISKLNWFCTILKYALQITILFYKAEKQLAIFRKE